MMRLTLCTAALLGMTSIAHAQTMGQAMGTSAGSVPYDQAEYGSGSMSGGCGHTVAITDEYGFRYDSMGDRLNAQGCVIAPPITPPGARAVQR